MRIAVWHNLPSGGGKRALYDHVRGLVGRGHHVEAWTPPSSDRSYLPLGDLIEEHVVPLAELSPRTPANLVIPTRHIKQRLAAMDAHSRLRAEQIAEGGFDILFANSCVHFRSAPIGRFVDLPSLLYLQEPYRSHYEATPEPFWAARAPGLPKASLEGLKSVYREMRRIPSARIQVREEVRSAAAYGRILCNSYFSRESILRAYGLDAEVCYLGVDSERFRPGPAERQPFLVSLGAFTPEKNPRLCIEAIGRMAEPRPSLVWVGNFAHEDHLAEMRKLADARGVKLDVRIRIPDEELLSCLRNAQALVYAPRLEPFGLAPIEAGACETAVVAVAEGGVRETVVDGANGLLVDSDPDGLAEALERVFRDPALARRLGQEGRRMALAKWSPAAATDRLIAKLEAELAAGRPRGGGASVKLSIALATYNGARFIREQLQSFADQERQPDEIVICDDGSTDETAEIIADFAKTAPFAVHFHANARRLGYSRNFEKAIGLSHGDIVFLSDQDDVWLPEKLATVAAAFAADPAVQVVANDQILTDGALNHQGITKLANLKRLGSGPDGLIEGCCTAFRRNWGELLLPIPAEAQKLIERDLQSHDRWINELSILLGVRRMIERPLQYFRRYGDNVTDWVVSEPREVGVGDLVSARMKTAPVEGWRDRVTVLDLYRSWLTERRPALEAAGGAVVSALAEVERERRSLEARAALVRKPLPLRLPLIAKLLIKGGYRYFYGWKSALRDIVRSAG